MLSRLHRKDHPLDAVTRTLRIRENKINILKTLDMYDPTKDYFHPLHPRNRPKSRFYRSSSIPTLSADQFNRIGTVTGRTSSKTFMAQSMLDHMMRDMSSNKLTAGTCTHDDIVADYAKLEELVAAAMSTGIKKDMLQHTAPKSNLGISRVSPNFGHVLRKTEDMVILSGGDV